VPDAIEHTNPTGSLPVTRLGGLETSVLGLGAMSLAGTYGSIGADDAIAVIDRALDDGITLIDTADVYGDGSNESLIGRVRARRDEFAIATKFGIVPGPDGLRARGDAAYVRACVDASLRRLGVDVIDLYYLHRRDLTVPLAETVGAMSELVAAGKVRHLGLSEVTAAELEEAHAIHPIAAVQSEWSIWSRDVERAVAPTAARLGAGFVPYAPLGRGFLTGTVTDPAGFAGDLRAGLDRFSQGAFQKNLSDVVSVVSSIAREAEATPAQIALAWLWAAGRRLGLTVVPIPGTRNPARVSENADAVRVELDAGQLRRLDAIAEVVTGTRTRVDLPDWTSEFRES
jgi:aryl-alcohol dehydrogenase-like predicted oxidoreductase